MSWPSFLDVVESWPESAAPCSPDKIADVQRRVGELRNEAGGWIKEESIETLSTFIRIHYPTPLISEPFSPKGVKR